MDNANISSFRQAYPFNGIIQSNSSRVISFINFCFIVSNTDHWDLRRWSVNKLQDELNRRNIYFDKIMGREELVSLLKREIGEETQISEELEEDFSKVDIVE
jgi:hypothetical protein